MSIMMPITKEGSNMPIEYVELFYRDGFYCSIDGKSIERFNIGNCILKRRDEKQENSKLVSVAKILELDLRKDCLNANLIQQLLSHNNLLRVIEHKGDGATASQYFTCWDYSNGTEINNYQDNTEDLVSIHIKVLDKNWFDEKVWC